MKHSALKFSSDFFPCYEGKHRPYRKDHGTKACRRVDIEKWDPWDRGSLALLRAKEARRKSWKRLDEEGSAL